jgi:K+-transporting ATPase KdpF subunit
MSPSGVKISSGSGPLRHPVQHARSAGTDVAWFGAIVSGTGVLANVVGGGLALLLIVYLFVALIKPEKF